jgi:predicted transcriptional regulator
VQEQLETQLRASKAELEKKNKGMSEDGGRSMEEALLAAVTLEDYQAAAEVCLLVA